MFAEGSNSEHNLRYLFLRSLKASYMIMIPLILCMMLIGPYILLAFGKSYSTEGITFLRLTLLSLLIAVPNSFFNSVLNIRKKINLLLIINILSAIVMISLTILFLPKGLYGLGIASIIGQFIILFVNLIIFNKYIIISKYID